MPDILSKRAQAWKSLQQDLNLLRVGKISLEKVLLSLLLLGLSSAWHRASNVGLQYLYIARNLMQMQLQRLQVRGKDENPRHHEFFQNALLYWEMTASFVDPTPVMPLPGLKAPSLSFSPQRTPLAVHPWTAILPEVHFALAEIGLILRRRRTVAPIFDRRVEKGTFQSDEYWAGRLEQFLHVLKIPGVEDVVDYLDSRTPVEDLILVSRAYKGTGLLEIYRAFPNVLWTRLENDPTLESLNQDLCVDQAGFANELDARLTAIAISTLKLVEPIKISSGACRLLPIILTSSASQLRLPEYTEESSDSDREPYDKALEYRFLVEARMMDLSRRYPQKPLLQMIDIIKEVWQRLEDGEPRPHWMDVAHEKGWQTDMG